MVDEGRVWFLDWLRVLAVGGVFVFHTLRPFDDGDWHVKNGQTSAGISVGIAFLGLWGLAFFFMISGAAAWLALRWRTAVGFLRERALRLLVPLVVAYVLLCPPQYFIEEHHKGRSEGSFFFDFFVVGFLVLSDQRLITAVRRNAVYGLAMGLGAFLVGLVTGIMDFLDAWWDDPGYSWPYVWYFTLITLAVWGWLVAALGFGLRLPAFQRPLPTPLARAAMPFFLIHQPVILLIAYYVVGWNAGIPAKYAVLMPAAFLLSALLAWLLSTLPGVSMLFGVKRQALRQPEHDSGMAGEDTGGARADG